MTEVNEGRKEYENCIDVTMKMMSCLRQHEYYDIMTADTAQKYSAVVDSQKENLSEGATVISEEKR